MDTAPLIRWASLFPYSGHVDISVLADTEDSVSLGVAIKLTVESQAPGGTWASPTVYGGNSGANPGQPFAGSLMLGVNSSSYELRARTQLLDAGLAVISTSDWRYVNWDSATQLQVNIAQPGSNSSTHYSRQITYKEVRDEVVARYYTATTPSTAELDRLATYITAANRMALQGYAFGEQWTTMSVTCANGKVLWADIYGADHREFYTADPRPADSRAIQLQEKQPDADGVWLDSGSATTVWAKFVPRFPTYTNTALVDATSYGQGAIGFVDTTGHCYECIAANGATGAEYGDTAKWRALPLLWIVAEPIKGFAEAALFARSQERGQAATIRAESQATLDELRYHDCGKLNQRQS